MAGVGFPPRRTSSPRESGCARLRGRWHAPISPFRLRSEGTWRVPADLRGSMSKAQLGTRRMGARAQAVPLQARARRLRGCRRLAGVDEWPADREAQAQPQDPPVRHPGHGRGPGLHAARPGDGRLELRSRHGIRMAGLRHGAGPATRSSCGRGSSSAKARRASDPLRPEHFSAAAEAFDCSTPHAVLVRLAEALETIRHRRLVNDLVIGLVKVSGVRERQAAPEDALRTYDASLAIMCHLSAATSGQPTRSPPCA